ncbi:MAG: DUF4900 domain-containing protein [Candidatus Omnitrophota bacterium]
MKGMPNNNKGFVFILAILTIVLVMGMSAAFFYRGTAEKRFVDFEKYTIQANFLSEAGANHGLAELRKRIRKDLNTVLNNSNNTARIASVLQNCYNSQAPLNLLTEAGFQVSGDQATFSVTPLTGDDFPTDIEGTYSSNIEITASAGTNPVFIDSTVDAYVFYFDYIIEGTGSYNAVEPAIQKLNYLMGSFSVSVSLDHFAKYAVFTNKQKSGPGGQPVWFNSETNFQGPVHTNDEFSFAGNPSFGHEVTQHQQEARYFNDGDPVTIDDDHNGNIDVPAFARDFERGIPMDENNIESAFETADFKKQALGKANDNKIGVTVPVKGGAVTAGIYVNGDVQEFKLETIQDKGPSYTIRQDKDTTVVSVDYSAGAHGLTTVAVTENTSGIITINEYSGIPKGVDGEGIIIYCKDRIDNLSGRVYETTKMTIVSEKDVVISNNVLYEGYQPSPLAATGNNVLGIISTKGNVRIGQNAPNDIQIHGIVAAPHGVFTVDNYAQSVAKGTATLLGGAITDYYGAFGTSSQGGQLQTGYARNFVYDSRVLNGNIPPFFPRKDTFVSFESEELYDRPLWANKME